MKSSERYFSRNRWLVSPSAKRGGFVHALTVPFVAAWRVVGLALSSTPEAGDVVSLKAPGASGVYWLASVGRSSREGTALLVLSVCDERPKGFREADVDPKEDPIVLTAKELRAADPRLVWRGEPEFWRPNPLAE